LFATLGFLSALSQGDDPPGCSAVDEVLRLLDLTQVSEDAYVGHSHEVSLPFFGGQVAAQALAAAARTVPAGRRPESLHAFFLAPGDPAEPLELRVRKLRDGRSFSARQVDVNQDSVVILPSWCPFTPTSAQLPRTLMPRARHPRHPVHPSLRD